MLTKEDKTLIKKMYMGIKKVRGETIN